MEKINITFLGTSGAIPTKSRNHTGIFINYKDENILFDCGEGIQRQFRYANISPTKLTRIFISHWHADHFLGLPGLFMTLNMRNYSKTLYLYGPKGTKDFMSKLDELFKIKIHIEINEISEGKIIENPEFIIEAEKMIHNPSSLAYSFKIKDKLRINKDKLKKLKIPNSPLLKDLQMGKIIKINNRIIKSKDLCYLEKGRKITIILDTKFNDDAIKFAKDSDILISESTFADDEKDLAEQDCHLTAKQAALIARKSRSKSLCLVHISDRHEPSFNIIEKEAKSVFKNVKIMNDLDQIIL
jgi:ribonuclease Z